MRDWGAQAHRLVQRRRKIICYRRVTRTAGPQPAVNPPSTGALLVSGLTNLGATSIVLRAAAVTGFLRAGDAFTIAGDATVYTISNQVTAAANAFAGLTISPALAQSAADGTAVTMVFAGDVLNIPASSGAYPLALVNGTTIVQGDLNMIVAGPDIAFTPVNGDLVFPDGAGQPTGRARTVKSVASADAGPSPAFWTLQAG